MFAHARKRVILADHSKVGVVSRVSYCALVDADCVIVDVRARQNAMFSATVLSQSERSCRWGTAAHREAREAFPTSPTYLGSKFLKTQQASIQPDTIESSLSKKIVVCLEKLDP
ncbi:hypothetical protein BSN85_16470 [Bradyrhizobium brasilense]|nr:hypothetical protein BSN85_16470 [Bradyrhizobium brasilense]